jgi:hypothetical protein
MVDLLNHALLDRGRLSGRWEVETETASIVKTTFGVKDKTLDAKIEEMEALVRDDLGDARSFGLDSPTFRVPRIESPRQVQR